MFQPKVSIIIPVYNGADYLRDAIDSALDQIYSNFEVIVVNDGSNDGGATAAIAQSYGDRVRYFEKPNGGVASALNRGIQEMTGEYFSWLSHDDMYFPEKLAAQVRHLERLEDRDVVLYSDFELVDAKGGFLQEMRLPDMSPQAMFYYLYAKHPIHGCTLLIPAKAFAEVGHFRENLPTTQDYDLWLRMCDRFPFESVPEILVKSRCHANQGSRNNPVHSAGVQAFHMEHLPELTRERVSRMFHEDKVPRVYSDLVLTFLVERQYASALAALRHAWREATPPMRRELRRLLLPELPQACYRMLPYKVKVLLGKAANAAKRLVNPSGQLDYTIDFSKIYRKNLFGSLESSSGEGSTLRQTYVIRRELPPLCAELGVSSILDVPCGDFHWMKEMDFDGIMYTGGDVVDDLVRRNQQIYGTANRSFRRLDIIKDDLPRADLVFCRDCLVHLPFADALAAIANFKGSGAKWLLTTTFSTRSANAELENIIWRPLNLEKPPFNLPAPVRLVNEGCTQYGDLYQDKCLGLWRLQDL